MSQEVQDPGTELARARAELAEQRALLDALPIATAVKDRDGRFLYANAAAAAGYGVSHATMIGGSERELLPPGNDCDDVVAKDREVIDSGRSLTLPGQRFCTFEGRSMVLHMTRAPVRFRGAPAVLVTAWDVTEISASAAERRQLERRIAESQRLEGLGLMAGGIAHDFNNLLVGVLANAELALREAAAGTRVQTAVERIKLAAERLAGLTRQMLAYSGRGHVEVAPVDVSDVARETLQLVAASISPRICVQVSLPEGLPLIAGDRAQLSQVIMNLVINAAEALGDTGTIRISADTVFLDGARSASLAVRSLRGATDFVCLEVSDDGPGMDDATRNRIFDPFFSTKGMHGRGLGLASVMGIVRAHQGALQVDSAPAQGTRMRVWLPLAKDRVRTRLTPSAAPAPVPAGRSVLVVDDEAMVRDTLRAVLEANGFSVHTASDGAAAIEAAKRAGRVDLVLLDMTMPGLRVADIVRGLRALCPDVPILFASGYSEPEVLNELLEQPLTQFIQKPFSTEELLERFRTLLPPETSC